MQQLYCVTPTVIWNFRSECIAVCHIRKKLNFASNRLVEEGSGTVCKQNVDLVQDAKAVSL